jgi:tetratricopeptide (TPR) repeat protein
MQKVLSEFQRHYGDVWLDLAAVDQANGRAFVDAYLDDPASPWAPNRLGDDFRAPLSERTDGHPLFTIELLREMQERGEMVRGRDNAWIAGPELNWETLPARVEAAVQGRIERLGEEQRDLLIVASVEGEVFTAQALAEVQGLSEREVLGTLSQELGPRGHRLVREAGELALQGPSRYLSRYQFGHALFQAYLYGCLTAAERRLLHGEIAAALELLYDKQTDQVAPALAQHYREAGRLENAVAYSDRAAELAFAAYAYETSIEHKLRSLRIYRQLGNRAGEAKTLHWLARDHWIVDDLPGYERYQQEALHIYRELGDRYNEADVLQLDGWASIYLGNVARSEISFQAAREIWRELGDLGNQANSLAGLGRIYREYGGDFERARACGEEARRLGQEAGDLFNEAIGEFVIGFALHYLGDYSAAIPHMQPFMKATYGKGSRLDDGALGLVSVGLNAIALGDYTTAQAHLERSRRTFHDLRLADHDDDAWAQSALALLYHQLGENQTARDYAARAVTIHRETGYDNRTATALTWLGHALAALGELTDAEGAYQEAFEMRRKMGQRHLAPEPLAGLARVALLRNDPEVALTHAERILGHLETGSVDGTDEPLRIYLTCYRVLATTADPRSDEVLSTAYSLLQERAGKIDDEELRRSYLENVSAHRELLSEWQAAGRDG